MIAWKENVIISFVDRNRYRYRVRVGLHGNLKTVLNDRKSIHKAHLEF